MSSKAFEFRQIGFDNLQVQISEIKLKSFFSEFIESPNEHDFMVVNTPYGRLISPVIGEKRGREVPYWVFTFPNNSEVVRGELFFCYGILIPSGDSITIEFLKANIKVYTPVARIQGEENYTLYNYLFNLDTAFPVMTSRMRLSVMEESELLRLKANEKQIREVVNKGDDDKTSIKEIKTILKEGAFREEDYPYIRYRTLESIEEECGEPPIEIVNMDISDDKKLMKNIHSQGSRIKPSDN